MLSIKVFVSAIIFSFSATISRGDDGRVNVRCIVCSSASLRPFVLIVCLHSLVRHLFVCLSLAFCSYRLYSDSFLGVLLFDVLGRRRLRGISAHVRIHRADASRPPIFRWCWESSKTARERGQEGSCLFVCVCGGVRVSAADSVHPHLCRSAPLGLSRGRIQ